MTPAHKPRRVPPNRTAIAELPANTPRQCTGCKGTRKVSKHDEIGHYVHVTCPTCDGRGYTRPGTRS